MKTKTIYHENSNTPFLQDSSLEMKCPECGSNHILIQGKNLLGNGVNKTYCKVCGFTVIQKEN